MERESQRVETWVVPDRDSTSPEKDACEEHSKRIKAPIGGRRGRLIVREEGLMSTMSTWGDEGSGREPMGC